jgi:hypothetical protein
LPQVSKLNSSLNRINQILGRTTKQNININLSTQQTNQNEELDAVSALLTMKSRSSYTSTHSISNQQHQEEIKSVGGRRKQAFKQANNKNKCAIVDKIENESDEEDTFVNYLDEDEEELMCDEQLDQKEDKVVETQKQSRKSKKLVVKFSCFKNRNKKIEEEEINMEIDEEMLRDDNNDDESQLKIDSDIEEGEIVKSDGKRKVVHLEHDEENNDLPDRKQKSKQDNPLLELSRVASSLVVENKSKKSQ